MNELFPLGTIVTIKGVKKPVMIIGYLQKVNGHVYDYMAVPHPTGMVSQKSTIVFDRGALDRLVAKGYQDEDGEAFINAVPRLMAGIAAYNQVQEGE